MRLEEKKVEFGAVALSEFGSWDAGLKRTLCECHCSNVELLEVEPWPLALRSVDQTLPATQQCQRKSFGQKEMMLYPNPQVMVSRESFYTFLGL